MKKEDKILIFGKWQMVNNAMHIYLKANGFKKIFNTEGKSINLTSQVSVFSLLAKERPDYIFFTGGAHGGIMANRKHPAEFIYDNIQAQTNIIHYSKKYGVKKLFFLGSSCVYPECCPQPMKEEYLLSGKPEEISRFYAMAKLSGIVMCQAYDAQYKAHFISAVPATVYGPGDNFDLENSHVLSALIRRIDAAKKNNKEIVSLWGDGSAKREFIYVDDLVRAILFLMEHYDKSEIINIGFGSDISIKHLSGVIKETIGFRGRIIFDKSKPGGARRKLLDINRVEKLGWKPRVNLKEGINLTYQWFKANFG